MVDREVKSGVAPGPIGGVPYADMAEVTGPPQIDLVTDTYREFLATDARSILALLYPNHYNFILNPSMRTSTTGWAVTGSPTAPTSDTVVPVGTDAVANSAAAVEACAPGGVQQPDGQIVEFVETVDKPLLAQAASRWDASQVASDRMYDLTGNGRSAMFGAGANAPVVLAHTGTSYLAIPTGTANANYISGITPNIPATASMIWDIETTSSLGSGLDLITQTSRDGAISIGITSVGTFQVVTWVSGVAQPVTWTGAVAVNTRKRYRVELTTTTVDLFIDDVKQATKTFGATRVPVANNSSTMLMTMGAATPTFYNIYSFNLYDAVVMNISNVGAAYTSITNTGTQGGSWSINRPATGYKVTVVDRPLLLFGTSQTATVTGYRPSADNNPITVLLAFRDYTPSANQAYMVVAATDPASTAAAGWSLFKNSSGDYMVFRAKDGTTVSSASNSKAPPRNSVFGGVLTKTSVTAYLDGVKGSVVTTTRTTTAPSADLTFGYSSSAGFVFAAAAVWERGLSDAEIVQASQELVGTATASPEVTKHHYVLKAASSIPKAQVPFPVTGNLAGYGDWTALESLDPEESWVGRSFWYSGSGTIRFKDPGGPYVYTGPTADLLDEEWYEPGRGSAQWTYSAYVMGPCEVRLLMDAYAPTDYTKAKSPPRYINLPTVPDAMAAAYDAAKPAIIDQTSGNVWTLKAPPFYRSLGVLPVVATPASQVPDPVKPNLYVQDSAKHVWKMISPIPASAPYYTDVTATTGAYVDKGPGPGSIDTAWNPDTAPPSATHPYVRYIAATPPAGQHPDVDTNSIYEVNSTATLTSYSYYEDTGTDAVLGSEWTEWEYVPEGEWRRIVLSTAVRKGYDDNSFLGCFWIDARLEFRNADSARFSSFMLDPTEYPVAQYFDGSMTETAVNDDFMWATTNPADVNNSISEYYYDRLVRIRFLTDHLRHYVPVGRPIQVFLGSYDDPHIIAKPMLDLRKPL